MKIGIITFNWAINYGAVIQAYALQEFLKSQGAEVDIINYKPLRYDLMPLREVLRNPKQIRPQLRLLQRDRLINQFRSSFLNQTKRYYSNIELKRASLKYDLVISGSDQVLNPSFTIGGEGKPTETYYLGFAKKDIKRIGYAVSFGCIQYPEYALDYALKWINNFDLIGVRENSGLRILEQLHFKGEKLVVPDPTLLYGTRLFEKLNLPCTTQKRDICAYLLGGVRPSFHQDIKIYFIDEHHKSISMIEWLGAIRDTNFFLTNSYHGMLVAILFHTPFAVIKNANSKGQNDRMTTVLDKLNLSERFVDNEETQINKVFNDVTDWEKVDDSIKRFRQEGVDFLMRSLS